MLYCCRATEPLSKCGLQCEGRGQVGGTEGEEGEGRKKRNSKEEEEKVQVGNEEQGVVSLRGFVVEGKQLPFNCSPFGHLQPA